jgi:hypothetical protein
VAAQLVASRVVLSSTELVSILFLYLLFDQFFSSPENRSCALGSAHSEMLEANPWKLVCQCRQSCAQVSKYDWVVGLIFGVMKIRWGFCSFSHEP